MVTCPSAINTTLASLRTHNTVVPCISALFWLLGIRPLYAGPSPGEQAHAGGCQSSTLFPSGSVNHPNRPLSYSSRLASTEAPAADSFSKTPFRSSTLEVEHRRLRDRLRP